MLWSDGRSHGGGRRNIFCNRLEFVYIWNHHITKTKKNQCKSWHKGPYVQLSTLLGTNYGRYYNNTHLSLRIGHYTLGIT